MCNDLRPPLWHLAGCFRCPKNPRVSPLDPSLPQNPWQPLIFLASMVSLFPERRIARVIQHGALSDWQLPLSAAHPRSLRAFSWAGGSLLFSTGQWSAVWADHVGSPSCLLRDRVLLSCVPRVKARLGNRRDTPSALPCPRRNCPLTSTARFSGKHSPRGPAVRSPLEKPSDLATGLL